MPRPIFLYHPRMGVSETKKLKTGSRKMNRVKSSAMKVGAVLFFCLAIAAAQDDSEYDVSYLCHI